jgi:hypothetical protein
MLVEVSVGEAIDKLNILEIKQTKIQDKNKLIEIEKEINELKECVIIKNKNLYYYNLLNYVNTTIWNLTDFIKTLPITHLNFANISHKIFEYNQKRFRLKSIFNERNNSLIKEQKSYSQNHCKIIINSLEQIHTKFTEIYYLSLDYDTISFSLYNDLIKNTFKTSNFLYNDNLINYKEVNINDIILTNEERNIFELHVINYISGGMLGDFIHQLSIIKEIYLISGRKGILYITDKIGDHFSNGLENTYKDIYDVVMRQDYIKDFKIYKGEVVDINLSSWREHPRLYNDTFYNIFKETYNIDWASHPWLNNIKKDDKLSNKILIHSGSRFFKTLNIEKLLSMFGHDLIFISFNENDYINFINHTNVCLPFYKVDSFEEICVAINSCKLFIGGLSSPLTIAHALFKDRIIAFPDYSLGGDNGHISNLHHIWPNIHYSLEEYENKDVK